MGMPIQNPVAGQLARYQGIFKPHWETTHVEIRVTRTMKLVRGAIAGAFVLVVVACGWIDSILTLMIGSWLALYVATPAVEWWAVDFPKEQWGEQFADGLTDVGAGPIEFEGVVGEPGHFGHLGIMRRVVVVHCILQCCCRNPRRNPMDW